jgi:hypothetical protein
MIANGMSFLCDPANEFRVSLRSLAEHKKGPTSLMPLQDLKQAGRVFRIRPIVKCESRDRISCLDTGNGSQDVSRGP